MLQLLNDSRRRYEAQSLKLTVGSPCIEVAFLNQDHSSSVGLLTCIPAQMLRGRPRGRSSFLHVPHVAYSQCTSARGAANIAERKERVKS